MQGLYHRPCGKQDSFEVVMFIGLPNKKKIVICFMPLSFFW